MRRHRSNPKRGSESGTMLLWYGPAHFVVLFRCVCLIFCALKFSDLPQTHCLCSSRSTWPLCTSTVPVPGFRNMTCKVRIIKWVICTLFVSKSTHKKSRKERDGTWMLLSPNQTRVFCQRLGSNILSSQRQHEGELSFGYQQPLSNSGISTGCCDSEVFTM